MSSLQKVQARFERCRERCKIYMLGDSGQWTVDEIVVKIADPKIVVNVVKYSVVSLGKMLRMTQNEFWYKNFCVTRKFFHLPLVVNT